jgi:hypothetical protein
LNTGPKKTGLAFTSIFGLILVTPLCGVSSIVDTLGHTQVLIQDVTFTSKMRILNIPGALHGLSAKKL